MNLNEDEMREAWKQMWRRKKGKWPRNAFKVQYSSEGEPLRYILKRQYQIWEEEMDERYGDEAE